MDQPLRQVLEDLFALPPERYADDLTLESVPGWSSISHLTLVLALEETFGVQFSPEEISELVSVRKIKAILAQHGAR